MKCSTIDCSSENLFSRGMCQACYYRLRRNGTVARKNVIRAAHCVHEGCVKPILGRNLCITHYRLSQHELNAVWKLLRSRNKGAYPPHWDRFDAFLADVGERPTADHKLKRHDQTLPFSKENVHWQAPQPVKVTNSRREYHAAYGREWNLRQFGIDGEGYARLMAEQDSKCAICRQPETAIHHRTGEPRSLAVDHDHKTGAVRGLLCRDCNTGLGLFDDDIDILRAAEAYLIHYAAEPVICS